MKTTYTYLLAGLLMIVGASGAMALDKEWTGAADTDWANAGNWQLAGGGATVAPDAADNVTILGAAANEPTLPNAVVTIINLTVENGATLTANAAGGSLTVTGDLAIDGGGTVSMLNRTLTVSGTTSTVDGALQRTSGTMNLSDVTGGSVSVGASGSITWTSAAVNVKGITVAGSISMTSGVLNVEELLSVSGTFTKGTGIVVFSGGTAVSIPVLDYHTLQINKSGGTATLTGAISMSGSLTLTTPANFDVNSNKITFTGGSSTLTANGGTLDDVEVNLTSFTSILSFASASTVINGDLTVTSGRISQGAAGRAVTGLTGATVSANGGLIIFDSGTPLASMSFLSVVPTLDPAIYYDLRSTAATTVEPNDIGILVLNGDGDFSLDGATHVTGTLTLDNGASLDTTGSNFALTVDGAVTMDSSTPVTTINANGSTVSFGSTLAIEQNATFNAGSGSVTVVGTTTIYGQTSGTLLRGVFNAETATVNLASLSCFNVNTATFLGGRFNAGSGVNVVTINGTLTTSPSSQAGAGGDFQGDTRDTIRVTGGVTAGNNSILAPGSGTFEFTGATTSLLNLSASAAASFNNIVVAKDTAAVLVSLSASATANGAVTVTTGILDVAVAGRVLANDGDDNLTVGANGTLRVRSTGATPVTDDYDNFADIVRSAGSTVQYLSAGVTSLELTSFSNLKISANQTFSLTAGTTVGQNVDITTGTLDTAGFSLDVEGNLVVTGTLTANASTINVAGDVSSTGTINAGTSTLVLDGVGAQSLSDDLGSYNNITISGNKTVTPTGSIVLTGSLLVGNTSTYDSSGFNLTVSTGDITLNGTLTFTTGTATAVNVTINGTGTLSAGSLTSLTVSGDWTRTGTFTHGTSTVVFTGINKSILSGTTFYNLTVSAGSGNTFNFAQSVIVNNTLAVTSGDLTPAASTTVTVGGTMTKGGNGQISTVNDHNFLFTSSATAVAAGFTFDDVDVQTGANISFGTATANTFDIAGSSTVGLTTSSNLGAVTVGANATVTVGSTGTLTVSTLSNGGSISFSSSGGLTSSGLVSLTSATSSLTTASSGVFNINSLSTVTGSTLEHGTGTFTVTGTASIGGDLTKTSGTVSVGVLDLAAGADYQPGTGSATYGSVTIADTAVYTTSVTTGTVIINGNLTIDGEFDAANGTGAFTVNGHVDLQDTGDFTIGSRTLNIVDGNWTKDASGTLDATGSTVSFNGIVANTLTGATIFNNLTLNKSSFGLTVFDNITVANLTLTAGDLTFGDAGAETVTVTGNITRTSGTITAVDSKFLFTGTGQSVAGSLTFFDVEIGTGATVTSFGATTITGTLTTTGTGAVTFAGDSSVANIVNNGSINFNTNVDITTSGNISNSGTMTFAGAGTIDIAGNWTGNGLAAGGTPTVTVSGNDSLLVGTYYNLTIAKNVGEIASMTGTVTVLNTLTLTSGTLDMAGNGLTLQGLTTANAIQGADGTVLVASGGTVTFDGTGTDNEIDVTAGLVTFHHVVINKGAGNKLDVQDQIAVTGDLTVTSGVLDIDAPVAGTAVTGNVSIASDGQILLGTRTLTVSGTTFTVNGTFSASTGTVLFNGGDNVAVSGTTDPITFGNLTVSLADAADTVDLAQNITASGSITVTEGILDASGQTVAVTTDIIVETGAQFTAGTTTTVGDDIQMDGGTYLAGAGATSITDNLELNSGTFNAGSATTTISGSITGSGASFNKGTTSTVRFTGAGGQTVVAGVVFNNVLVERSSTLTVSGTFDVDGTLTINNTAAATTVAAGVTDVTGAVLITLGRLDTSGATTLGSSLNIVEGEFENLEASVTVTGAVTVGDAAGASALLDLGAQVYNFGSLLVAVTDGTVAPASGFALTTGAMTVNGTFGIVSMQGTLTVNGAYAMAATGVVTFGTGDPTINFNGTVSIPAGASWTSDNTTFNMNGTSWTQGTDLTVNATSVVKFGGTTVATISMSGGATSIPNLEMVKAAGGSLRLLGNIIVDNDVVLTSGPADSLNLDRRTLTLGGSITGTPLPANAAILDGDDTVAPDTSTLVFNGTGTKTILPGIRIDRLTLNNSALVLQVPTGGILVDHLVTITAGTLDLIDNTRTITGDILTPTPTFATAMGTTGVLKLYRAFSESFPNYAIPASPAGNIGGTVDWLASGATSVEINGFRHVNFSGTGNYTLDGNTTVTTGTATVTAGAQLNTGSAVVSGTGTFTLNAGASLGVGSVEGIADSGATGSIQTTTRNYDPNAIYVYNGAAQQVTGNGLPGDAGLRVNRLTIENASGVILSQSTTASNLNFSVGHLYTTPAGSAIVLTVTNTVTGNTNASGHVVGQIAKLFTSTAVNQTFTFPVGDGTSYTPVIITDIDPTATGRLVVSARTNYVGDDEASYPPAVVSSQQVAGLNKDTIIPRSWTIDMLDGFTGDFDPQFAFLAADVTGLTVNTEEAKFVVRRYNEDVIGLGEQWFGTAFGARVLSTVPASPSVRANDVDKPGDYIIGAQAPAQYVFNLGAGVIGFKTNVVSSISVDMADYIGEPLAFGFAARDLTFAVGPITGGVNGLKVDAIPGAGFQEGESSISGVTSGITIKALGTIAGSYTLGVVDNQSPAGVGAQTVYIGIGPTAANGGAAADFDGSGMYGLTPDLYAGSWNGATPGVLGHEAVTVEMWFRADAAGVLLDERGKPTLEGFRDSWIELVETSPGVLDVRLRVWNLPSYPTTGLSLGTVATDTWNHVVLRYTETSLATGVLDGFLNGVKSSSSVAGDRTTPIEHGVNVQGMYFGLGLANDTHLGSGAAYNGSMDEVRIWNVARTDEQILAAWNKTVDPASANLVAYYQFEDGVGSILTDETGNNNFVSVIGNTPVWGVSSAMTNVAARTFTMLDNEDLIISLNGYDPDNTGVLNAQVDPLTGYGTFATLRQTNSAVDLPNTFVTVSNRLVVVHGVAAGTFTFRYRVNNGISTSADAVITVNVLNSGNTIPTLTTPAVVTTGNEDSAITINYSDVVTGMSVNDVDGGPSPLVFELQSVVSGTLQKAGNPVTNFVTTLATGESFTWTPPMNQSGVQNAFTIKAYDGQSYSVVGTAQVSVTGQGDAPIAQFVNTALELRGTNYLFTPNLRNEFADETVTLELWFRPSVTNGVLNSGVLVSERGQNSLNGAPGWRASQLVLLPTGEIKARAYNLTSLSLGYVQTNEWNHVVMRYNKATSRTEGFLNGVKSGFVAGDRTAPWEASGPTGLYYDVGAFNNGSSIGASAYFRGHVNEFRVWSVARSDAQITNSYPGQPISAESGLVAWYQLDDALVATTAADSSGNGFNASLLAGAGGVVPQFVEVPVEAEIGGDDVLIKLDVFDVDTAKSGLTWFITEDPAEGTLYQNILGSVGSQISAPPASALVNYALSGGKVFYRPPAASGSAGDSFKFQVSDGSQLSAEITVNIIYGDGVVMMNVVETAPSTFGSKSKAQLSSVITTGLGSQSSQFGLASSSPAVAGGLLPVVVAITSPTEGGIALAGEALSISIQTTSVASVTARVDIFANGVWIGQAVTAGSGMYELAVEGLGSGSYLLTAIASDADGSGGVSAPVEVTVYAPPPTQ